jgi:DNA polymerase-3 subunit beta
MTGTDLDVTIRTPLDYTGEPLLLPAVRLQAILGAATGDEVTLTPDGTSCTIQAGNGTWRLPTENAAEFPRNTTPSGATSVGRLPCDQFRTLVGAVRFATDSESSRFALAGVMAEFKDGELSFVGTDGRRMCVASADVDQDLDESQTLIPRRVVDILYRLASGHDSIQLERTSTLVVGTIGETIVSARQIEGRFPKWRDVEPTRDHVKASLVQVGPLLHACEMAAICASEDSKGVTLTFGPNGIFMQARSSSFGESSATCEVVESGTECTVAIDPRFAVEWLRQLDAAETVEVEAENASAAVVFRAENIRNVVMPLAKD